MTEGTGTVVYDEGVLGHPDTSFKDLGGKYELDNGFALIEKTNLVLASPRFSTRRAQSQFSSAHDVFPKRDIEDVARLLRNVMVSGAHWHIFCSDVMIYHRNGSFRAAAEREENAKGGFGKGKERVPEVFEVKNHASL